MASASIQARIHPENGWAQAAIAHLAPDKRQTSLPTAKARCQAHFRNSSKDPPADRMAPESPWESRAIDIRTFNVQALNNGGGYKAGQGHALRLPADSERDGPWICNAFSDFDKNRHGAPGRPMHLRAARANGGH